MNNNPKHMHDTDKVQRCSCKDSSMVKQIVTFMVSTVKGVAVFMISTVKGFAILIIGGILIVLMILTAGSLVSLLVNGIIIFLIYYVFYLLFIKKQS